MDHWVESLSCLKFTYGKLTFKDSVGRGDSESEYGQKMNCKHILLQFTELKIVAYHFILRTLKICTYGSEYQWQKNGKTYFAVQYIVHVDFVYMKRFNIRPLFDNELYQASLKHWKSGKSSWAPLLKLRAQRSQFSSQTHSAASHSKVPNNNTFLIRAICTCEARNQCSRKYGFSQLMRLAAHFLLGDSLTDRSRASTIAVSAAFEVSASYNGTFVAFAILEADI